MANLKLTGWGRGTWTASPWNRAIPLAVTQSALTSALGSVVAVPSREVPVTQSALTSALGTTSFVGSVSVAVTQGAMTSAIGSESVVGSSLLTASTNVGTSAVGTVHAPTFSIGVFPTGLSATGSTGEENVWGLIDTAQTSNFSAITASQTPNWIKVAA
tara:strand:+ start:4707 stop:5183 length:477 start_codon:yes stop_codon:yes gene_type:complete